MEIATILWIIAVVVGIIGVVRIIQGAFVSGVVLVLLALLIGPGGVSLFDTDGARIDGDGFSVSTK